MKNQIINPWWVVAAAFIILGCNMGVRLITGLLLPEISRDLSVPSSEIALSFGFQNLLWGAISPLAGMVAERYGTAKTLFVGAVIFIAGMFGAAFAESSLGFFIANAILIGVGVGATTYPIVLGAVGKRFPVHKRTFALGITSAGGSLGQFFYATLLNQTDAYLDWSELFMLFGTSMAVILIACWFMRDISTGEPAPEKPNPASKLFNWHAVGEAFKNRDYQLLNIGFFVCGFHIAIMTVHMAGVVSYCGLPPEMASSSLAVIGLTNVLGVVIVGWAGDRWHKPWLLLLIYWLRSCLLIMLLFIPMNTSLFYGFSVMMGVLWLSTVPLTSGAVAQIFGTQHLASLFGFVMFSHQIGAFIGSWLGGIIFDHYGSYELALIISAGLGVLAAAVHLPITPKRMAAYQAV